MTTLTMQQFVLEASALTNHPLHLNAKLARCMPTNRPRSLILTKRRQDPKIRCSMLVFLQTTSFIKVSVRLLRLLFTAIVIVTSTLTTTRSGKLLQRSKSPAPPNHHLPMANRLISIKPKKLSRKRRAKTFVFTTLRTWDARKEHPASKSIPTKNAKSERKGAHLRNASSSSGIHVIEGASVITGMTRLPSRRFVR